MLLMLTLALATVVTVQKPLHTTIYINLYIYRNIATTLDFTSHFGHIRQVELSERYGLDSLRVFTLPLLLEDDADMREEPLDGGRRGVIEASSALHRLLLLLGRPLVRLLLFAALVVVDCC